MENIVKSWATTLFGLVLWGLAAYETYTGDLEWWQTGLLIIAGFVFLWMRDSISGWISELIKNLINRYK